MILLMRLASLSLVALLVACAAPPQRLATASGKPEVTIPNASRKAVIDKLVAWKLEAGMNVKSASDYGFVASKAIDNNFMASFLYGSSYNSVPEARLTYSVVESPAGVRVFGRTEIVTNPGGGFERVNDVTEQAGGMMLAELERLRDSFKN